MSYLYDDDPAHAFSNCHGIRKQLLGTKVEQWILCEDFLVFSSRFKLMVFFGSFSQLRSDALTEMSNQRTFGAMAKWRVCTDF